MSELKLIKCVCPADPAGPPCPVPHDRWLGRLPSVAPISDPYPCLCSRRGCSPQWCECSGRVDLEGVLETCCARNGNTPHRAAAAVHGSDYRTCWCKGDIDLHKTKVAPPVMGLIPDLPDDDEEED